MELNWLQSLILGLFSGFADILPVSAQAHKAILLKLFGESGEHPVLRLMIHLATLAALYLGCQGQIRRIRRQMKLARIPKHRRKRPLDTAALMDVRLLKTTLIPIVIGLLVYLLTSSLNMKLSWIAVFLIVNGVILYLPAIFPTANKDARSLSPAEGLLMGLGAGASVLPGISSVGASYSLAVLCGAQRNYAINMSLLMHMLVTVGMIILDLIAVFTTVGLAISFGAVLCYILAALAAFAASFVAVRLVRTFAEYVGFERFSLYCWGVAFLSFILFLLV